MSLSIEDLAEKVGARVTGSGDLRLEDVASLATAGPQHVTYVESRKHLKTLAKSSAGAVLISPALAEEAQVCPPRKLIVDRPQAAFISAMLLFRPLRSPFTSGIHSTSLVHATARYGQDCAIGPHAVVGRDVRMGSRCQIGAGVVLGEGVTLGDDCLIHANAVLYPGVTLGSRVIVHAQAVIGADGFGYRFEAGAFVKIPHTGTVLIEDDVEIGACTTIDRGMIDATVIGRGTKLDNQVMIAHNCRVGRHNVFASHVGLAGSVTTGDYVQMGGQAGIADHAKIAGGVRLGGKAGVMGDLPAPGGYHGIPAVPEKEAIRNHLNVARIPEIREQIKDLQEQLDALKQQLSTLTPPAARLAG